MSGTVSDKGVAEAEKVKVGKARLSQGRLQINLLPGLAVSGQLIFDFTESDD
jgi:hypothetical protein